MLVILSLSPERLFQVSIISKSFFLRMSSFIKGKCGFYGTSRPVLILSKSLLEHFDQCWFIQQVCCCQGVLIEYILSINFGPQKCHLKFELPLQGLCTSLPTLFREVQIDGSSWFIWLHSWLQQHDQLDIVDPSVNLCQGACLPETKIYVSLIQVVQNPKTKSIQCG